MIDRVSDEAVAASIAPTLRAVHAAAGDEWSRQTVAQLIALVEYVGARPADPLPSRRTVLVEALDSFVDDPLVPTEGRPEQRAAAALVGAIGRVAGDADSAAAVRARLRAVLVAELDDELASTMALMDGFRGRVGDA